MRWWIGEVVRRLNSKVVKMHKQDVFGRWKKDVVSGFTIFLVLVCITNLVLNVVNGRFWLSDFKVYYMAAKALISGGTVYLQSFMEGSGYYKYRRAERADC